MIISCLFHFLLKLNFKIFNSVVLCYTSVEQDSYCLFSISVFERSKILLQFLFEFYFLEKEIKWNISYLRLRNFCFKFHIQIIKVEFQCLINILLKIGKFFSVEKKLFSWLRMILRKCTFFHPMYYLRIPVHKIKKENNNNNKNNYQTKMFSSTIHYE